MRNVDQYFKQAAVAEAMVEEMISKFLIANPRAQRIHDEIILPKKDDDEDT